MWGHPHIIFPSSCRTAQHPHISSPPSMQQFTAQRSLSPFSFRTGSLRSRSKNSALRIVSERSSPWTRLPICQLTNDRTGWPLEIQIKEAVSQSRVIHTPEKPAAEAVADHQGPRSEGRGQPPAEVGDPSAQRVEKRPVECYTRIPRF
jgi:hypothetical protein